MSDVHIADPDRKGRRYLTIDGECIGYVQAERGGWVAAPETAVRLFPISRGWGSVEEAAGEVVRVVTR